MRYVKHCKEITLEEYKEFNKRRYIENIREVGIKINIDNRVQLEYIELL